MDWTDSGIVLGAKKHGESSVIVSLLTTEHGRHLGLVRGGAGKRARGIYEAGNVVSATWRARLEDHLGSYTCEMTRAVAVDYLNDPLRLAGLTALCALAETALPERQHHPALYGRFWGLIEDLPGDNWQQDYVLFELELLSELGFGLDLSACAGTGATEDLIYVSPKTGRAVSAAAGEIYKEKLLPLPAFLLEEGITASAEDIRAGLILTSHFLERTVFVHHRSGAPAARQRFIDRLSR